MFLKMDLFLPVVQFSMKNGGTMSDTKIVLARDKKKPTAPAAEWVPVSELVEWAGNPRKNQKTVEKLKESIKEFGFSSPIVARLANGEIIAGHARFAAAKELGLESVPVRFLDISEKQAHTLSLADNKIQELSTYDYAALSSAVNELDAEMRELSGFSESEIASFINSANRAAKKHAEQAEEESEAFAKEIDVEAFKYANECPKCKFQF